jgi:hypothetical protein
MIVPTFFFFIVNVLADGTIIHYVYDQSFKLFMNDNNNEVRPDVIAHFAAILQFLKSTKTNIIDSVEKQIVF